VAALGELSEEQYSSLMALVRASAEAIQSTCQPEGMNIGINLGTAAGAGIEDHLHVHVVPRWSGDTNFMTVVGDTRVMSQDLAHAWNMLRPAFEPLDQ
jgi:ATP adenylyltransferase